MIGSIIGDIAGSIYEFNNLRSIIFPFYATASFFTDDSVMNIAVAEWLLNGGSLAEIMRKYGREYPNLSYGTHFQQWLSNDEAGPYNSFGNGSAMRVTPIAWFSNDLEEVLQKAKESAEVTHNHPEGIKGAQATAAAIFLARTGASKAEIKEHISKVYNYDLNRSCNEIRKIYKFNETCQGTVPEAIIAFLESWDFESAIRLAISLGGDSDTLACITGGIAEAYYKKTPFDIIEGAVKRLKPELLKVVKQFYKEYISYPRVKDHLMSFFSHTAPYKIEHLKENEIFVFGSNLGGQHAGGAARLATHWGAEWGKGVGLSGQTYAIPTMHGGTEDIRPYVEEFIAFAQKHPELEFLVTRIGCGIANFTDEEIAPLFRPAIYTQNISLPISFWRVLVNTETLPEHLR